MRITDLLAQPKKPIPMVAPPERLPAVYAEMDRLEAIRSKCRSIYDEPQAGNMIISMIYCGVERDYEVPKQSRLRDVFNQALDDFEVVDPVQRAALIPLFGSNRIPLDAVLEQINLPQVGKPKKAWLWITQDLPIYHTRTPVR